MPGRNTAATTACFLSSGNWVNVPLSQVETQNFRITYDATPSSSTVDAVTGLSSGTASQYTNLAAIIRFNALGAIDARNGSAYVAASVIPYAAGVTYHFALDVNIATHTYNAYVTLGSTQATIGTNLAFRSEQSSVASLGNLGAMTSTGSHAVCNIALNIVVPSITTQPANRTVSAGQTANFTVASTGTAPLTYQWNKNGVAIAGANSSSYTTALTATADNGANFNVVVSNAAGSATSAAATLTVTAAQLPAGCLLSDKAWVGTALGQTQTGSFRASFDATPATSPINGITGLSPSPATAYQSLAAAVRFNPSGFIDARNGGGFTAAQAIPYAAATTYHFILDVSISTHTYNAYVIIGGVQLTVGTNLAFRTEQATASSLSYLGARTASGSHTVCNLMIVAAPTSAPSITSQPASVTVGVGQSASFSVSASGTSLTYQWKKNGVALSGATSSSYTTPLTGSSDTGAQFTVVVSNAGGSVASNAATLTVSAASTQLLNSSTTSLSFGSVTGSSSSTQAVTLTNAGNANVIISQVSVSGAGFTATGATGLILSPGQSTALTATFAPAATGSATGSIAVTSNATNSPAKIALSGSGVAAVAHSVSLSWTPGNSAVTGYHTYSSTVSGGPFVRMTSTPQSNLTYIDTTVQSGRTYYYVVTAVDSLNQESPYSSEVTAIVP